MQDTIWFNKELTTEHLKVEMEPNTLGAHLGMEWSDIGPNYLQCKMPVDGRTRQPYGLLHGGASVALAETCGSVASFLVINSNEKSCVGMEINANHLRSVRDGYVYATAKPLRLGKTNHVWDIRITDDRKRLVCVCRLTVAIISRIH